MNFEEQIVKHVIENFEEGWNRHDMEAFGELFAQDAEFINVSGLWWKSRAEIRQAHETIHATIFRHSRLTINETAVRFLTPDVAVARSVWNLTGQTNSQGGELPSRRGILTNVLSRNEGKWLIIDSQNIDIVSKV